MRREVEIKLACGDNAPEVGPKPIKMQAGQRKFNYELSFTYHKGTIVITIRNVERRYFTSH
jgi:hypothetical protein